MAYFGGIGDVPFGRCARPVLVHRGGSGRNSPDGDRQGSGE